MIPSSGTNNILHFSAHRIVDRVLLNPVLQEGGKGTQSSSALAVKQWQGQKQNQDVWPFAPASSMTPSQLQAAAAAPAPSVVLSSVSVPLFPTASQGCLEEDGK